MVEVLGRGVIIITGPLCQSRSGNLWVSGWEGVGGTGSHLVPKIYPGLKTARDNLLHRQHSPREDGGRGGATGQMSFFT